ncbi:polyphosphate kinase 1 [Fulvivirga lutea]|uniref:Polyphosphate kinase n=1 Tax=Fulvivirga lutea TaxID=2810512 RepID=A0A974WIM7_9BACT|nr:polyphosphate kinase 1 [Fulvivirga lutea]QSE98599.1 polyphosphate kinase 1 [Fulvivirga lutea]
MDYKFFDRDLSWLSFNKRILMEAADDSLPIYDRIKFLAIYSSNLDEFFRVRVAAIRSIVEIDKKKINSKLNKSPKKVLKKLLNEVHEQQEEFGRIKRDEIIPELKRNNIIFYRDEPINDNHRPFLKKYFRSRILSYLQPIILTKGEKSDIFLENRKLYFIIDLKSDQGTQEVALLNIPSDNLSRYVELPRIEGQYFYIAIDDIIRENLSFLFPKYKIDGCYSIKINRDADLYIDDEYSGDLVDKIKKQIAKRNLGVPSRFLYDQSMPKSILEYLTSRLDLNEDDLVPGGRYHNMHDLFSLPNPLKPELESKEFETLVKYELEHSDSIFDAIDKKDVMLHFPYQSYDYVLRFFNEAALDPDVEEIKATFYRIAPESFICNALISAAHNGKKVTVFVEIKARFDEQNNLQWAERMQKAGITIIYSMPGLKVHAKVALVRKKQGSKNRNYGYYGTGNFNEKTAEIYADQAIFSTNESMNKDLSHLFQFLENNEKNTPKFNSLLVSQFNLIEAFELLIEQEIKNVESGGKGHIIIKLNNLQDTRMISKLYDASNAGVKIEMIVRSICCLIPNVSGQSENITVRRIVDTYLEHSRAFYFYNNGQPKIYQGSADWMVRNLDRRFEVVFPVLEEDHKEEITKMLELQLNDTVKGVVLTSKLENKKSQKSGSIRSQREFYNYLSSR